MTARPKDGFDGCAHANLVFLGHDRDARFMRCQACGEVFVAQGGQVWAVPAMRSKDSGNER